MQDLLPEQRLDILRVADRERKWYSRVCAVCDRVFSGRQVEIPPDQRGLHSRYPTSACPSKTSQWFLTRSPLRFKRNGAKSRNISFLFHNESHLLGRPLRQ
jgi:hypothetical protein